MATDPDATSSPSETNDERAMRAAILVLANLFFRFMIAPGERLIYGTEAGRVLDQTNLNQYTDIVSVRGPRAHQLAIGASRQQADAMQLAWLFEVVPPALTRAFDTYVASRRNNALGRHVSGVVAFFMTMMQETILNFRAELAQAFRVLVMTDAVQDALISLENQLHVALSRPVMARDMDQQIMVGRGLPSDPRNICLTVLQFRGQAPATGAPIDYSQVADTEADMMQIDGAGN